MSRPIGRPRADKPKYCLDKSSGRAFVTLEGRRRYLGRHGTQESRDLYDRLIGEWIAQGRPRNLVDRRHRPHRHPDHRRILGRSADAVPQFEMSRRQAPHLRAQHLLRRAETAAPTVRHDAGQGIRADPAEALREEFVRMGWSRGVVNKQISRIRRVFAWAVEEELLAGEIYYRLCAVKPLKLGRTKAPETEPTLPVSPGPGERGHGESVPANQSDDRLAATHRHAPRRGVRDATEGD